MQLSKKATKKEGLKKEINKQIQTGKAISNPS
jgi:hypothetical protein